MTAAPQDQAQAAPVAFYIGTYTTAPSGHGKGIYRCTLDPETGVLADPVLAAEAPDASWLVLSGDGRRLYAALEGKGGGVSSYWVGNDVGTSETGAPDPIASGGMLHFIQTVPMPTGSPCHLSLDAGDQFLLAAAYGTGYLTTFATLGEPPMAPVSSFHFTGSGPDLGRQKESHAHSVYTDRRNRFAYACDLGGDDVACFAFDPKTGAIAPQLPFAKVPPGSGPRHLAFSKDDHFVYVNGEMKMNVTAFSRDPATGALTPIQTVDMTPVSDPAPNQKPNGSAEVLRHPSGKWLYVSNRGWDNLVVFRIGADGKLEPIQNLALDVKDPRGVAIDPSGKWMIAAGQKDDSISLMKIDPETGLVSLTGQKQAVGTPVAVAFMP